MDFFTSSLVPLEFGMFYFPTSGNRKPTSWLSYTPSAHLRSVPKTLEESVVEEKLLPEANVEHVPAEVWGESGWMTWGG